MGEAAEVVFDGTTCKLLLFGPCCNLTPNPYTAQTWLWDGKTWGRVTPASSPPAVIGAAVAYDPDTHTVIMFGGIENGPGDIAETWAWNGTTWTHLHPLHSPSPRDGIGATYDEAHHQVVIFGGNVEGPGSNDTWTWDGHDWHLEDPDSVPPRKTGAGLAYDPARKEVVLFGGDTPNVEATDTWGWDGITWRPKQPEMSPPPTGVDFTAIGYDPRIGKVVLVLSRGYTSHETWTWDGSTWTRERVRTKLPNRSYWELVYDPAIQKLVLLETWGADGSAYGPTSAWVWTGSDWMATAS
jgi:hypothetical protein